MVGSDHQADPHWTDQHWANRLPAGPPWADQVTD